MPSDPRIIRERAAMGYPDAVAEWRAMTESSKDIAAQDKAAVEREKFDMFKRDWADATSKYEAATAPQSWTAKGRQISKDEADEMFLKPFRETWGIPSEKAATAKESDWSGPINVGGGRIVTAGTDKNGNPIIKDLTTAWDETEEGQIILAKAMKELSGGKKPSEIESAMPSLGKSLRWKSYVGKEVSSSFRPPSDLELIFGSRGAGMPAKAPTGARIESPAGAYPESTWSPPTSEVSESNPLGLNLPQLQSQLDSGRSEWQAPAMEVVSAAAQQAVVDRVYESEQQARAGGKRAGDIIRVLDPKTGRIRRARLD